jgi:hypothetical protein
LRNSEDSEGIRYLGANLNSDGDLVVTGQDIGSGVSEIFGSSINEYEWVYTIKSEHISILTKALGGMEGDNIIGLIREKCTGERTANFEEIIREQVPHDFWNWMGDD